MKLIEPRNWRSICLNWLEHHTQDIAIEFWILDLNFNTVF